MVLRKREPTLDNWGEFCVFRIYSGNKAEGIVGQNFAEESELMTCGSIFNHLSRSQK